MQTAARKKHPNQQRIVSGGGIKENMDGVDLMQLEAEISVESSVADELKQQGRDNQAR